MNIIEWAQPLLRTNPNAPTPAWTGVLAANTQALEAFHALAIGNYRSKQHARELREATTHGYTLNSAPVRFLDNHGRWTPEPPEVSKDRRKTLKSWYAANIERTAHEPVTGGSQPEAWHTERHLQPPDDYESHIPYLDATVGRDKATLYASNVAIPLFLATQLTWHPAHHNHRVLVPLTPECEPTTELLNAVRALSNNKLAPTRFRTPRP